MKKPGWKSITCITIIKPMQFDSRGYDDALTQGRAARRKRYEMEDAGRNADVNTPEKSDIVSANWEQTGCSNVG
jgi:hypothetical protein